MYRASVARFDLQLCISFQKPVNADTALSKT